MAIQNSLYGRDLSEDEAAVAYQAKSVNLTKLAGIPMPAPANHRLSMNADGTNFILVAPDTNNVPEGTTNLYFTPTRVIESIAGAASTIVNSNLSTSRALISDANGKVIVSTVTTTELGYLAGVTSTIQTQIDNKIAISSRGIANGVATLDSSVKVPTSQIPALTTTVGFGGEVITVPYTGNNITLPLPINMGGTGTTTSTSALSALGAQTYYPILTALHMTSGVGFIVKNASGSISIRSLQVDNPLSIVNPNGNSGDSILSIIQGDGSGLDADKLDGLHSSSFLRVDGSVMHTVNTSSTIRASISAASSGANGDITSLSKVTGIGNNSLEHIQITSSGGVGIGDSPTIYGKAAIRGGKAGTADSSLALLAPNGSINNRSNIALYSTFGSGTDTNIRRTADIVAGYNSGIWGTEYLSLNVGNAGDTKLLTTERVRIDGNGNVLVGKTTTTTGGGDVQVSRGLTFPTVAVPCSNTNTLDDYREGTWVPVMDTYDTPGAGRITQVYSSTYTKIGNVVIASCYIRMDTLGSGGTGGLAIKGLPFTSRSVGTVNIGAFYNLKSSVLYLTGSVEYNTNTILIRCTTQASTSIGILDFATFVQASSIVQLSTTYEAF